MSESAQVIKEVVRFIESKNLSEQDATLVALSAAATIAHQIGGAELMRLLAKNLMQEADRIESGN